MEKNLLHLLRGGLSQEVWCEAADLVFMGKRQNDS